jgi:hypothetical protein
MLTDTCACTHGYLAVLLVLGGQASNRVSLHTNQRSDALPRQKLEVPPHGVQPAPQRRLRLIRGVLPALALLRGAALGQALAVLEKHALHVLNVRQRAAGVASPELALGLEPLHHLVDDWLRVGLLLRAFLVAWHHCVHHGWLGWRLLVRDVRVSCVERTCAHGAYLWLCRAKQQHDSHIHVNTLV